MDVGNARVIIRGDYSGLAADFGAAQSVAASGSKTIGSAVQSGFVQATGSVDAFRQALAEENAVLALSIQRNMALAQSARQVGDAHHAAVTEIQATSGALRVLEGSGGIRAAERFLTLLPGLGAALQVAFPVVGAIALFESMGRLVGKSEELKQAEDNLRQATEAADAEFAKTQQTMDRLNVDHVKALFGGAAGTGAEKTVLEQQAGRIRVQIQDLADSIKNVAQAESGSLKNYIPFHSPEASIDKIKTVGQEIKQLYAELNAVEAEASAKGEDSAREFASQWGAAAALRIKLEEDASARAAEISRQRTDVDIEMTHRANAQRIDGLSSEYAKVQAAGQEEIRFEKAKYDEIAGYALATRDRQIAEISAKARAESAGKAAPEQQRITIEAAGDVQKVKDEYTKAVTGAQGNVDEATQRATLDLIGLNQRLAATLKDDVQRAWDSMGKTAQDTLNTVAQATERQIQTQARVSEVQAKAGGISAQLGTEAKRNQLEADYASQVSHTREQEIAYMRQIAALNDQANTQKLTGLALDLQIATATGNEVAAARVQLQLLEAAGRARIQNSAELAKIAGTQAKQSVGSQLGSTAEKGEAQLTSALVKGITDGGKGLGRDIRSSLQNVGKEMLGDVLQRGTEELVIALTGNTLATNINTLWLQIKAIAGGILGIFGFADGGRPAPGVPYLVGERGPEIRIDDRPGSIIPTSSFNFALPPGPPVPAASVPSGGGPTSIASTASIGDIHFHAHGVQTPASFVRQVARDLPNVIKTLLPGRGRYQN